MNQERY